jgi:uncharacterized protein
MTTAQKTQNKMANIFGFLAPKEKKFFPMFERATENLVNCSKFLVQLLNTNDKELRKQLTKEIENSEHIGDNITHEIFNELSATFITPFDREDITQLTSVMDDINDYIHGSTKRIELYKIEVITPEMQKLGELIEKAVIELNVAVQGLRNINDAGKIKEALVRINSIENHADDIFDSAIGKLFDEEKDPIKLIKYKEVLQGLEVATDKCEDAADVIKTILIKYS